MAPSVRYPRPVTIHHVAEEASVSKSTVSLVLQGSPLVRDETAERVREAAHKLGYVYNRRAAELRRQSSNMIGVVINDLMNPFFAELLAGVERRLMDAGYIVLMAHAQESPDRQRRVLQSMREHHAAGILLCPALGTPRSLPHELLPWGIPLVVMVRSLGAGAYDYAGSDNECGVRMATRHLVDTGHRRIAFLGGRTGPAYAERLRGYRKALAAARIPFDPQLVIEADPGRGGGRDAMARTLRIDPRPTAAVCYNDITAFGALAALGEQGLRAGADFALIGFDNVSDAAHSNPPLSTVDIHPGDLGEQAAAALMARIAQPSVERQIYLAKPRLMLRRSG
ncbi:LacI family DNA-binding transcriptional regulator [Piscinibacter sp. XHJ-5]|uniref:LacI family DNA-binding transcriptional regulator n=1 Tax=Piscinibacter sp. XHJ-5 TaxID=3037797 RepID=UPI0024531985|nr:LacI family DNA-binding transcriptional regulator [Piscinibacter sp. XHJ-5]